MRIPHGLRAALASQSATPPTPPTPDANFENVSLLLHGDGTNGAQNNTFTDGSANNFTITRAGNTTQGTFSPFSPTGWSGYFDGTGDYLTYTYGSDHAFGTGDFTVEWWMYSTDTNSGILQGDSGQGWGAAIYSGTFYWQSVVNVANLLSASVSSYLTNDWRHWALSRSGSTLRLFIDGNQIASVSDATNYSDSAGTMYVGYYPTNGNYLNGYISNLRIVKGTAVYTSNFTPPTSPLTAITNTSLLTLQDNRFKDNSTNNFTITRNGDTKIEAFSPFNPTAAYSASTHGGSGYFDGSGDKIYCTPSNLTGQFTIEGWWYAASFQSTPVFCGNWGTGCLLRYSGGQIQWHMSGSSGGAAYTLTTGQWYHMAVTRDSSNVVRVFANGVQLFSLTNSGSITMTNFCIGSENITSSTADIWNGYISGFRILNGTCLYNSAFTPPTSPPTAIANTNLLVNFTNGGIIDNASKNVLETVGNAQISTSVKKFGTGSMYFDGTGDYLLTASNLSGALGTADFTVEMWVYPNGTQDRFDALISRSTFSWYMSFEVNNTPFFVNSAGTGAYSATSIPNNTWTHVAACRSGTTLRLFQDGIQVASTTFSSDLGTTSDSLMVGYSGGTRYFNGYIDDLRITKGVARYTANFTPPTQAFPDL